MLKPFLVATTLTLSTSNAYAQGDRPSTQEEISQYCSQHEDDGNPGVYLILPYKENNFEVLFCNENNDNDTSIFKHDCKSLKRLSEIFQTSWASRSVEIGQMTSDQREQGLNSIMKSFRPALETCDGPLLG